MPQRNPQWEERLVHYLYIQDLFLDSHVLEIGCGNGSGADFLAEYARRVTLLDSSAERVDRYRRERDWHNLDCMVGDPDRMQFPDDTFDVVLVPELERWVTRGSLLPEIRRVLRPRGVVLFAVPSGDNESAAGRGMAYEDLEEYLSQTFAHVRIMGTIPFQGVTVADFDPEGELEPQLDCSLVSEDQDPVSYLALCSSESVVSPGYCVVQVPGGDALQELPRRTRATVERWAEKEAGEGGELTVISHLLEREMERAAGLEQRLEQTRSRSDDAARRYLEERGKVEVERVRGDAAERQLALCQRNVDELRQRAEGAERRCDSLLIRIEQGAAELSTLHHRMAEVQGLRQADQWHIDELVGKLRKLEQGAGVPGAPSTDPRELERARARIVKLERELEQLQQAAPQPDGDAEAQVVAAEQRAAEAEHRQRKAEQRANRAEQRAREAERLAGEQLQEKEDLEKELMRSESRVTENARRATNAEAKIAQMEVRLKRSESEAATLSKWAEELREELKAAQGKSSAVPPTPEPEVAALRNELHEARQRVSALEQRCDALMAEVEQGRGQLREREQRLEEAMRAVDRNLFEEVVQLRRENIEVTALREQLKRTERELDRLADQLRDTEQAEAELGRTRRELMELKHRVRDVDAASEELEQLRLEAVHHQDALRELERLRGELEQARIELTRCHEEARGGSSLPEEAGWTGFEEEEDEEEPGTEGYVGAEMPGAEEEEDEEEGWDVNERIRVQERQIEALLEGAALHRAEMERQQAQVREMDALITELQTEQRGLEQQLEQCERSRGSDQQLVQQLREDNTRLGRDLARVQGELRRCQEEQAQTGATAAAEPAPAGAGALQEDLDREVRARQRLQEDLERRLTELDELRRELRRKDQAMDKLRSEDTEHRAELRELGRQLRELERDAGSCKEQLAGRDERISRLQQQLAAAEEQITCLKQDLSR